MDALFFCLAIAYFVLPFALHGFRLVCSAGHNHPEGFSENSGK
jgi:hypothetical protein